MLIDDLADIIEAAGHGTFGTDIVAGGLPEEPDAVVALVETPGRKGEHAFGTGLPVIERPRVQIRVRGAVNDYAAARTKAERIYQLLAAKGAETVTGGARYLIWDPLQPPFALGQDRNGRWVIAFNVETEKEASAV